MKEKYSSEITLPPLESYIDFFYRNFKIISRCAVLGFFIGVSLIFLLPSKFISTAFIATGAIESDKFTSANRSLESFKFYLQSKALEKEEIINVSIVSDIFETAYVNKLDNAISLKSKANDASLSQKNLIIAGDSFIKFLNTRRSTAIQRLELKLASDTLQIKHIENSLKIVNNQLETANIQKLSELTFLFLYKNNLLQDKAKLQESSNQYIASINEINSNPVFYLKKPIEAKISVAWYLLLAYASSAGFVFGILLSLARKNLSR